MKQNLLIALLSLCLVGCHGKTFNSDEPYSKVRDGIRSYYLHKYPEFAELVVLQDQRAATPELLKRIGKLHELSPVKERVNSFPDGPPVTFIECNESSKTMLSVATLNLYASKDGTCRLVVDVDTQPKKPGVAYSTLPPISEEDILKFVTTANK